jgi:hypothetical protein
MSFHSGMNFETGSVRRILPSSIIISVATPIDRLGHRHDAEDAVLDHRLLRLELHDALCLVIGDAPVARDQRDRTVEAAGGDVTLNQLGDALESLG